MSGHRRCCCGSAVCNGCPCCTGGALCATPGALVGVGDTHRFVGQVSGARNFSTPQQFTAAIDELVEMFCLVRSTSGPAVPTGWFSGMSLGRGRALVDLPTLPGLRWWETISIGPARANGGNLAGYWRPDATYWNVGNLTALNPTRTVNGVTETLSATIGACAMSVGFTYTQINANNGQSVQLSGSGSIGGVALPCPSTVDLADAGRGVGGCCNKGRTTHA